MATRKQREANRRNAQKSTGPQTAEGRAAVRFNALKHGLAADVLLPGEDEAAFNEILEDLRARFQPIDAVENILVNQMAMAYWRQSRYLQIEAGFYSLRTDELPHDFADRYTETSLRCRLGYILDKDAKGPQTLATLSRYETRAERSFYRALHELQRLQAGREGQQVPVPEVVEVFADEELKHFAKQSQFAPAPPDAAYRAGALPESSVPSSEAGNRSPT
ncbi:MAG: hypothetical protein WD696_01110 [Bryobacteraceae bacterium]